MAKISTNCEIFIWIYIGICTMSWWPENHSMSSPGCRPPILKPKLYKESKNGFKPINYCSPLLVIFSKNYFQHKKIVKKWDLLLIFEFLCQYMCISKTNSEKYDCRTFRIVEKLQKYWKLNYFFMRTKIGKSTKGPIFPNFWCFKK